ncbi:MAG: thermonuclease family protein [Pyrinomonadaceae bacterium]
MKLFLTLIFVFGVSLTAFAQQIIRGQVTNVLDGRTITVETPANAKFTVQLQFIEVPESKQPLAAVVKGHLEKLVLGKTVQLRVRSLAQEKQLSSRVLISSIDLSEQLLRDGAAWYAVLEKDLQDSKESEIYQAAESAAKSEKRGVWGIEGLKPWWELQATKEPSKTTLATKKTELLQPLRHIKLPQTNGSSDQTVSSRTITPKSLKLSSAQKFFEQCNERGKNFDISVVDCYSDKAIIQNTRRYPNGQTQTLKFPTAEFKKLIVEIMPVAKAKGDYNTYSNVTYTTEGKRIRINATRYSEMKKYYSPISVLVGQDPSGSWRIYEEISESQP